jgi:8-oxo-dGTP diphosphatase
VQCKAADVLLKTLMLDALYRTAYRVAYRGARIYWHVFRPENHGALVALWCAGRVLLVKNSYVDYYSLPGGNVRANETAEDAAIRELKEEINLVVERGKLITALVHTHEWQGRPDHVVIFALELEQTPAIRVDHREVVSAEWLLPQEALSRDLFPPLRQVIEQHVAAQSTP